VANKPIVYCPLKNDSTALINAKNMNVSLALHWKKTASENIGITT
jgi:hypothetical protein